MFSLVEEKRAQRVLTKMQPKLRQLIRSKMIAIAIDPYGHQPEAKKLQGREGYRLRIGDWRVLYSIEVDHLIVRMIDVLPRGSAYKH